MRRIQEVALEQFAERGYHGVSIRDIAKAAGVQPSSVYAHVSSKEQLLHDLVLLGHQEHHELLREALLGAGADPADQLRALVRTHVLMHATYPVLATVSNNELHALSEQSAARINAIRDDGIQMFLDVVRRGVQMGRFHCADPFLAVAAIGGMGIRVAVWFRAGGGWGEGHVADTYADFAVKLVT